MIHSPTKKAETLLCDLEQNPTLIEFRRVSGNRKFPMVAYPLEMQEKFFNLWTDAENAVEMELDITGQPNIRAVTYCESLEDRALMAHYQWRLNRKIPIE